MTGTLGEAAGFILVAIILGGALGIALFHQILEIFRETSESFSEEEEENGRD